MWVSVASLNTARRNAQGVLLQDGRVLVVGGNNDAALGGPNDFASAELYDPVADTWTYAAPMNTPRYAFQTATLLLNGKVLVTGGANGSNAWLSSTEVYDPKANTWTNTGNLPIGVYGHTATLLKNGNVLVGGGVTTNNVPVNTASLYNPKTNKWSSVPNMTYARTLATATLLNNGKVPMDTGWTASGFVPPELYDPKTGGAAPARLSAETRWPRGCCPMATCLSSVARTSTPTR